MSIFGPGKMMEKKESGEAMDLEERLLNSLNRLEQTIWIERVKVVDLEQVIKTEKQKVLELEQITMAGRVTIFNFEQIIRTEREKLRELERAVSVEREKVFDLELEQRKVGTRFSGECNDFDKRLGRWSKLAAIKFGQNEDHFTEVGALRLIIGSIGGFGLPLVKRVFTRITQGIDIQHFKTSTLEEVEGEAWITFLPQNISYDNNIFIQSWIWVDYYGVGGNYEYELEFTFDGHFEQKPKCYYYNINYIEH